MTEKQFIQKKESIINTQTDELVNASSEESAKIITIWLNDLYNKYTEIKKENYGNLDGINYYQEENASQRERISDLECENEQLKQQIQDCEFAHRTEMAHHRVVEKELKEKNGQLKQQIKDLQVKNDSIEWLRNNTAWEQIPSIIRTSISTNTVENPYCDKRKVNKR